MAAKWRKFGYKRGASHHLRSLRRAKRRGVHSFRVKPTKWRK